MKTTPYYTNLPNQNPQGYRLWSHCVYSVTEQIPKTDSCPPFCIFLAKEKQANKSPTYNPHTLAMFFLHSATVLKSYFFLLYFIIYLINLLFHWYVHQLFLVLQNYPCDWPSPNQILPLLMICMHSNHLWLYVTLFQPIIYNFVKIIWLKTL